MLYLPLTKGEFLADYERVDKALKAEVHSFFARYDPRRFNPVNVKIHSSDLEIMKSLISDPRLRVEDIAKETSLSPRTEARRLEKMKENHILQFTIFTDSSSTQLTGFIVFVVLIDVHVSYHQNVVQRIQMLDSNPLELPRHNCYSRNVCLLLWTMLLLSNRTIYNI